MHQKRYIVLLSLWILISNPVTLSFGHTVSWKDRVSIFRSSLTVVGPSSFQVRVGLPAHIRVREVVSRLSWTACTYTRTNDPQVPSEQLLSKHSRVPAPGRDKTMTASIQNPSGQAWQTYWRLVDIIIHNFCGVGRSGVSVLGLKTWELHNSEV